MPLTDQIASSEATLTGLLAAANASYFAGYARRRTPPARAVAAGVLVLVNVAVAAECALYLALLSPSASAAEGAATLMVRTALLLAVASLSALVLRRRLTGDGR